jgi:sugar/nucleoside kinase (ribokinase family)
MVSSPELDCLVAGDANIDLLLDGVIELEPGKEKLAQKMEMMLGGSSAITAYNLAMMMAPKGGKVGFSGIVGDDLFGSFVKGKLEEAGLDLRAFQSDREEKTGLTVWHSKLGERAAVTYSGTIAKLRAAQVSAELERARHLHVGAYFLLKDLHAGALALFRRARRTGLTTSLDCNYDPSERWDSNIREVLAHTEIFFPNETEALRITRTKTAEKAALRLSETVRIVAIKLGERGVLMRAEGNTWTVPAVPARVVDTTGAGDSFNAGFLSSFLSGASPTECAKAGAAAAARTIAVMGGTTAFESTAFKPGAFETGAFERKR